MAVNGKKKSKVFFIQGNGSLFIVPVGPGDQKVKSPWNPGKSRNRFNKKLKLVKSN